MSKPDMDILSLWGRIKGYYCNAPAEEQKVLFKFVRHIYNAIHECRAWNLAILNREIHRENSKLKANQEFLTAENDLLKRKLEAYRNAYTKSA